MAKEQGWQGANNLFVSGDINEFVLGRLLITVPMNEPPGFWGPHHKLHGLNERHFPGFEFNYINEQGVISDEPQEITESNTCNLIICKWSASE